MLHYWNNIEYFMKQGFIRMKREPFVAIEFNAATVRLCRSIVRGSSRVVTHCFSFPISVSWQDFPKEIIACLKSRRLCVSKAVLMLPRDKAASHLWVFPSNDPEELRQMVKLRVSRECFGMDGDNVLYDYKIIGADREGCAQVMVFLIQKQQIDKYAGVLRAAGIMVEGVTLNTVGLFNWLRFQDIHGEKNDGRRVFLLNADDRTFDLQLHAEGKTVFSKSFHVAATEEIRDRLSREIKLGLELCRRQQRNSAEGLTSTNFCVTGSSEKLLGLDIESWLGESFRAFDPLEEARAHLDLKSPPNGQSISYAAVLGLALLASYEGADLTPDDMRQEMRHRKKVAIVNKAAYSAFGIFCVFSFCFILSLHKQINTLNGLYQAVRADAALEIEARQFQASAAFEQNVLKDKQYLDALKSLYAMAPANISLSEFKIVEGGLASWSGESPDAKALFEFLGVLRQSPLFKNARLEFMGEGAKNNAKSVQFEMGCLFSS